MTKKDIDNIISIICPNDEDFEKPIISPSYLKKELEALALEQDPVLDNIRAEIKTMFPPSGSWMYEEGHEVEHTVCEVLSDVLQIIDKYRSGGEW